MEDKMNNNSKIQNPNSKILRILLIEDNPGDARLIKEMLKESGVQFEIESADRLSAGIGQVKLDGFDVILLDLGLPDSQGLGTLMKLNEIRPEAPVIVLTGLSDEEIGTQAVKQGAQDYLIKGQIDQHLLSRSIRYAIARKQAEDLLVASEQKYRILVETMNEGLGVQDKNGMITYMNRRACEMFGYEPEELIGRPVDILFDEEGLKNFKAQMAQRRQGKEENYEVVWRRKDGVRVPTIVSPHVIYDAEGKFDGSFGVFIDITDRKKAEEALQKNEEQFRTIFEQSPTGIEIYDAGGKLLDANAACMEIFGIKKIDVVRGFDLFADPNIPADVRSRLEQGESVKYETMFDFELVRQHALYQTTRSGQCFLDCLITMLRAQDRSITGYLVHVRDITERKQLEAAAQEQRKRFETFFDTSITPLAFLDKDFNFIRVNKAYAYAAKREISEFPGHNHFEFYPSDAKAIFEEVVRTRTAFQTFGRPFVYADHPEWGVTYWNWTLVPILDNNGAVEFLAFSLVDVTEQKKSEAFIKNILESVGEGFIVIDPEYKIISANRAYCEMQKTRREDMIGRHCYEISHRTNEPCFMMGEECAPKLTFKTGEPHLAVHTHYDNNDNPIYIETRAFPMKDTEGKVFAVIEILNNVTEKRTLENQLRHAQKMEAIGQLAGGIAHDFNNMLNVIIGYASLMQMNMSHDDPKLEQVKEILNAGDRAAHLTKGLLTFSRKQVMEIRRIDLNEIIENFKKMLTRIIGEDIELRIILHPSVSPLDKGGSEGGLTLKADIVQIEQVLMNLASNAKDAMPKGGILTIETMPVNIDSAFIRIHGYGEPGMHALITVSDTGAGMDDRTREKIFEPFFTTKEFGRGTGLGLSIVYGIIKQHNGYINCYSEPGKGTTFKIYLPLIKEEAEKIETAEAELPRGGTETILIAEDDASVRDLTKQILEGFGYTVIEAVDGIDAVNKFKENKDNVHLLLFDLIMPNKNGKDAYEDIQGIRHDIKVIFTSGYAADIIQRFGIEEGIDFISKPVSPHELLRKVRDMLG